MHAYRHMHYTQDTTLYSSSVQCCEQWSHQWWDLGIPLQPSHASAQINLLIDEHQDWSVTTKQINEVYSNNTTWRMELTAKSSCRLSQQLLKGCWGRPWFICAENHFYWGCCAWMIMSIQNWPKNMLLNYMHWLPDWHQLVTLSADPVATVSLKIDVVPD